MAENEGKIEGWLYFIRCNRLGLHYSRKSYFILEENCLKSFKSKPTSRTEEPVRRATIDSCIRIVDNGRVSHHRKVFFIFTLLNTSNHNDQLKLGATSSEEAAKWIHSLQDAAVNPSNNMMCCSKRKYQPFSLTSSKRTAKSCTEGTSTSSVYIDAMTSDVIAPSPWKIFGYQNGLRLFREAKDRDSNGRYWNGHPAVMAVGVIEGTSEAVFHTLMSLGTSRTEWDFCFYKGSVIEQLDGHTDIIHVQLYNHWLPWIMNRRDMLLRRYWRREDDGTYVILYHSVVNRKCPPQKGYVRACVKSGGYVITAIKQGEECMIKHILAVDWKFWKSYIRKAASRSITIRMLGRVAALRELYRARAGNTSDDFFSGERITAIGAAESRREENSVGVGLVHNKNEDASSVSSLSGLNDAVEEFFDFPETSDYDMTENGWPPSTSPRSCYVDKHQPKLSSTANFVKKLHEFAVQKKGYVDLQAISWEESVSQSQCYGTTLSHDSSFNMACSWAESDPSAYLIRGDNYPEDQKKIKAAGTLMQIIGADWIRSDKREDDLSGRNGGMIQEFAAKGGPEFFFVVNIQVPGTSTYSLALYFILHKPLAETSLLDRFVNGDDSFRNSRFKLIPYISKGSWIVKQSVGRKACLIGHALQINYFRGKNYLELGIDIGSSTVARGVVSLVLGYLNNLVIEMAFVIQGNTAEELPEVLLGTCRLNHLDACKAVSVGSIREAAHR